MERLEHRFVDPEEMAERMVSLARRIAIRPTCRGPFRSAVNAARLSNIAILSVSMTPARVTSPEKLGYTSVALGGTRPAQARINGRVEPVTSDSVSLHSAEHPLDFRFVRESEILVVNLVDQPLGDYCAALGGGADREPVHLPPLLRLDDPATQSFRRLTEFLYLEIRRESPLVSSNLVVEELEKALVTSLLLAADSQQSDTRENLFSAHLQRAVDYIMANLSEPLSLGKIAAAAGVHARTLLRAFRAHFSMGVMEFVRDCRLAQSRDQLLAADADTTSVTSVALANGFWHLGRFSAAYKQRFGELPSQTLRR